MNATVYIGLLISWFHISEGAWIDRKAEGWAWYEDPKQQQESAPEKTKEMASAQEQLTEIRKQLDESLAEAVLHPSEQNIRRYMVEQKKLVEQSSYFANTWGKVLLQHPELDPTNTKPVTQYGIQIQKEIDYEMKKNLISALSNEYGLFFFYEGNNRVSQGLSHVVKSFSEKYKWLAVGISIDGSMIDGFQNSKVDNGIAEKLGITVFPAIFLINPKDQVAIPIAYGLSSLDQIEDNIVMQFNTLKDE